MKRKEKRATVKCTEVVQVPLLPEYVEKVASLLLEISAIKEALMEETTKGYSLTVMYDPDNEQYTVRLAGTYQHCDNPGLLLYGNGESLDLAWVSLYIKHFLVSGGGVWVNTPRVSLGLS